jgi:hypothetical protein
VHRPTPPAVRLVAVLALVLAACTAGGTAGPSATVVPSVDPFGSPGPTTGPDATLDPGDLRIVLVERLGPHWYCDPDEYPIARPSFDEGRTAIERFPEMQAEGVVFNAVVRHLGLAGSTTFTDDQKLAIYREWKVLVSIALDPAGNGRYAFDYLAMPVDEAQAGVKTRGTIDTTGAISVAATETAGPPNCPICLARGTPIDTPTGDVPAERVTLGQAVWTIDSSGERVVGTVIAVGSTIAPAGHAVIRLFLADGRTVTASPGHPLADGRRLGALRLGDTVDGSTVTSLEWLPYGFGRTYDLIVSGPTGVYLSDGIALGSTLR